MIGGYLVSQNNIKVGDATFTLPEGYKCVANGKYANITNGNGYIILQCNESSNIAQVMDSYVKNNNEHNLSLSMSNLTLGKYTVYKSVMDNNTQIVHYWFNYDNKVYEIYTRSADSNTDSIVKNLINSAK